MCIFLSKRVAESDPFDLHDFILGRSQSKGHKVIHASTSLRQIGYQKVKCKRRNMLAYVVCYRYQDFWACFLLLALKGIKMLITFSACNKDNKINQFFSHFPTCWQMYIRPHVHGTWVMTSRYHFLGFH